MAYAFKNISYPSGQNRQIKKQSEGVRFLLIYCFFGDFVHWL